MQYVEDTQYPCGYRRRVEASTSFFSAYKLSSQPEACPLHGKTCPRRP